MLLAFIIGGVVLNTIFLVREIRRNEQHDAFINAVTHELKTPVASIRLYLQTLQTRNVDEDRRKEFYRIMLDDSDRLLGTIEQILRTGRIGSGNRNLNLSRFDLRQVVAECVERTRALHHLPPEGLLWQPDGPLPLVAAEEEVRAAVANLIDNAVKYSGSEVRVAVTVVEEGNRVAVRVTDRGAGIPKSELKRIFKRFYRVPGPLDFRRAGHRPGLAHRALGGAPPRRPRLGGERGTGAGKHLHFRTAGQQMTRILVVEDERHLADGLRFNLEAEGYAVEVAGTGEEALELMRGPGVRPPGPPRAPAMPPGASTSWCWT